MAIKDSSNDSCYSKTAFVYSQDTLCHRSPSVVSELFTYMKEGWELRGLDVAEIHDQSVDLYRYAYMRAVA